MGGVQKCIVAIDGWQMQCCGVPFKVGDKVEWIVGKHGLPSKVSSDIVDYYYEHHSSEWRALYKATGRVSKITTLFYSVEPHPDPNKNQGRTHSWVYKESVDVTEADGWDEDIGELKFGGYEVCLHHYTVRPALQREITFS
ncbi:MAG: hypothetical protein LBL49_04350 [Clostridiales Family XIII bacterium]|jgi:hypothetical protein|nr:hypothetical protein [Clostridiales Family XIII bacterium]